MGRRRLLAIIAGGLVPFAIAAGPVVGQRSTPAPAPSSPAIEGPVWRVIETFPGGISTPVPPGITADALFWAGTVSGSAGCGTYSTSYTLAGPALTVDAAQAGPTGCDADARELQDAFLSLLPQATGWTAQGSELMLVGADGQDLMLLSAAKVPSEVGIATWQLARLADADGRLVPITGDAPVSARFLPGGRVVGDTGCGRFLGAYSTDGTDLSITDLAGRTTDCVAGSPAAAQAEALLGVLERAVGFDVTPAGLSLLDAAGARQATWVPAAPPADTLWVPVEVRDATGKVIVGPDRLQTSVVSIDGTSAGGRTSCHPWSASVRRSGLALTFHGLAVGKGRCRPPIVEKGLLAGLRGAASYALRGDRLELLDAEGRPLVRLAPQQPLTGVSWQLTRIDRSPATAAAKLVPPVAKAVPTAVFSATDGLVSGSTGCNDYAADFTAKGNAITISGSLPSGRSCKPPVERQEEIFLDRLAQVDSFIVKRDALQLFDGDRVVLEFRPIEG